MKPLLKSKHSGNIICDCKEMWLVHQGQICASCEVGFKTGNGEKSIYCSFYREMEIETVDVKETC